MRENSDAKTDASTKPTVTIPTSEIFTVYFSVRFIIFVNFIYIDVDAFLECFILQERPRARDHIPMLFIIISNSGRVRDPNARILISDGAWNRGNGRFSSAGGFLSFLSSQQIRRCMEQGPNRAVMKELDCPI